MKRLHVALTVENLNESVEFYTHLFASKPTVLKPDYAKWMLDDPRVNFSLTPHGDKPGVDHLGMQAEDDIEFKEIRARLTAAESVVLDQPDVNCCYAKSTKAWIRDPNGVAWETFFSRDTTEIYGDSSERSASEVAHERNLPSASCCSA